MPWAKCKLMKAPFYLFVIAVVLYGCSATPVQENGALPQDLDALQQLHKDKQKEARTLQMEIEQIEAELVKLDPTLRKQSRVVNAEKPFVGTFRKYARIQGSVQSKDLIQVTSEVPGRLTSVTVDEGHNVNRGQLIATVDVEGVEKQKDELEKSLELAREVYVRQERLWNQNIGSELQYLEAKNSVERLEKSIETLDYQLTKSRVYAPITGVIDMVNLKAGQLVQPGVPILTILDTRNVKVVADVPESYIGKVDRGEKVEVIFPALGDTTTYPVTLIGRKIDPTNRTFKVEVNLTNSNGLYKPNLLAEVLINSYTEEDALVISQELVQEEVGGRKFVFVVNESPEGTAARKVYVTTGQGYDGNVVIKSGLSGEDVIITKGSRGLAQGELISIIKPEVASNEE